LRRRGFVPAFSEVPHRLAFGFLCPNSGRLAQAGAAKRFRAYVNPNPKINPYLQLNTLIGTGGLGIGAGATLGDDEEKPAAAR
jgi:hypothetical protein